MNTVVTPSRCVTHRHAGVILLVVAMIFVFSAGAVAQEPNNNANIRYGVRDIEAEGLLKGAGWVVKWAINSENLRKLIPLYGYRVNFSDENLVRVSVCEGANKKKKLGFFTALSVGKTKWIPAQYRVGSAGVALQQFEGVKVISAPNGLEDSDINFPFIAYPFNRWPPEENGQEIKNTTLGSICGGLKARIDGIKKQIRSDVGSKPIYYLVTQNPVPDIAPDRLLWTDPIKHALSAQ